MFRSGGRVANSIKRRKGASALIALGGWSRAESKSNGEPALFVWLCFDIKDAAHSPPLKLIQSLYKLFGGFSHLWRHHEQWAPLTRAAPCAHLYAALSGNKHCVAAGRRGRATCRQQSFNEIDIARRRQVPL